MNKKDIEKFIKLGFLLNEETFSVYGQEIVDNFIELLINNLKRENFKHLNIDIIKENISGRYYRINGYYFEIVSTYNVNNNEALDIYYLFSKFIKNTLAISFYEGYKDNNYHYRYYYAYNMTNLFIVKQNKDKVYLRFDLRKIFYSVYKENDYFSYNINKYIYIIPLHQNKSGVLSYANKIKSLMKCNVILNDENISPIEKKNDAVNKRIGIIIYVGPKELKHQNMVIECNNEKETLNLCELNIDNYFLKLYKTKLNNNLKEIYYNEKEIDDLNKLKLINKINICDDCLIKGYHKFLVPFNRVTKSNYCLVCKKSSKNLIYIKKRV